MNDLKFACRQLLKNPGFTAVAVLTLALGIGANTAMFSIVNGVLLRPLPFKEPDRIVMIWESSQETERRRVSPANFLDWQKESTVFEAMSCSPAWAGSREFNFVGADGTERVAGAYVSSGFFPALGVTPQMGRWLLPDEDTPDTSAVAVLSHGLWQQRFGGDPNIVGRTLTLDSFWRRDFTIVGVMPPEFQLPTGEELWVSAGWMMGDNPHRSAPRFEVIARLKPGVSLVRAQAEMNLIQARIAQQFPEAGVGPRTRVVPLREEWVGSAQRPLLVLSGAVGLILLIACGNVANLLLARAASRRKEITLRLVLGARRWRIVRQLLTESVLLASLGGVGGVLLANWGVQLFIAASPAGIARLAEVAVDDRALAFTAVAALLTGLAFGLAPAWQGSRTDVNETLKGDGRSASSGIATGRLRGLLVSTEVALATVLLVAAGLMLQSFTRLMNVDRGIREEKVVTAELDFSVAGYTTWITNSATRPQVRLQQLIERVRELPGVQSVGAASHFLRQDNGPALQPFAIFGRPPLREPERPTVDNKAISPDYLDAVGMRLLRGRAFTEADVLGAPGVVLVNESFVRRFFPGEDPVGKHLTIARELPPLDTRDNVGLPVWSEIVGVVSDVKSLTTQPQAVPEVYWSYWQWPMQRPTLFVRAAGDPAPLMAAIHRETKTVAPNVPSPDVRLMADRVGASVAQPRFQARLLNLCAGLALLLAACGIYGVLAYSVTQRQREIGIRIALGAPRNNVLGLVLRQGMRLTLLGVGLGVVAALALTKVLQNLLYEVRPTDPVTYAAVTLTLLLIALLACWLPARRAAKVDPMVALRSE
jgi:putative ABC transport system permease protein